MKFDKGGLLLVGAAAAVLLLVVNRSTSAVVAGSPASGGQNAIGSNAASFWSNAISNLGGSPVATTSATAGGQQTPGGLTLFGNGTFDANGIYTDPGQVTYNTKTGGVQESPFAGMYNVLSPGTYGF